MSDKRFILLVSILVTVQWLMAQPKENSPVTRFGIGDIYHGDFNQSGATGGLFGAWIDPHRMNPVNPAALPYLQATSMEAGFFARYNNFRRGDDVQPVWSGNLDYMSLAFPLKSRITQVLDPQESPWDFGMGFHLSPYSIIGYDIELRQVIPDVDSTRNIFQGQGAVSLAAWSAGVKYRRFSVGAQLGYLFGRLENRSQVNLLSTNASYSTRSFATYNLYGFHWQLGAMYRLAIDPKSEEPGGERKRRWINMGAYISSPTGFVTRSDLLLERVNVPYSSSAALARDTLIREDGLRGNGVMPARIGIGATLQKGDFYQVGFNVDYRNWSVFEMDDKQDFSFAYRDAVRYSIGGEWSPDPQVFKQYMKKIRYRAGLFYESDPRVIQGRNAIAFGVQAGFGLPIILPRQQVSFIDVAVEAGRRGDVNVQRDSYIRLRMAATLTDNSWFYKRKYN
jgi:hypothetical protein